MRRHEQSDEEWATIQPLLPQKSCGVPRVDDRRVVNGILWRFWAGARRGGTWPSATAPHTTLYNRFVRWHAAGVWDRILDAVSEAYDGDIVMIDSCLASVSTSTAPRSKGGVPRPAEMVAWDAPAGA